MKEFKNEYLQSDDWTVPVTIDGSPCKAEPSSDRTQWMVRLPRPDSTVTLGSVLKDEKGASYRVVSCHIQNDGIARLRTQRE